MPLEMSGQVRVDISSRNTIAFHRNTIGECMEDEPPPASSIPTALWLRAPPFLQTAAPGRKTARPRHDGALVTRHQANIPSRWPVCSRHAEIRENAL